MNASEVDPFQDPELVNQDPHVLTVWSDIGCPWASLALHTVRGRARERDIDLVVDHRAFPLELFNRRPTPKVIIDVEVAAIAGAVTSLDWRPWAGRDSAYVVTTLPAMAAVQAAKDQVVGGLRASDELDAALRRAFYEEGRCISVYSEILEVAESCPTVFLPALEKAMQHGHGIREVFDQWRTAREFPVQGSPHIFLGDRHAAHNPGVTYRWTAGPGAGFVRFEEYDPKWADVVLDLVAS